MYTIEENYSDHGHRFYTILNPDKSKLCDCYYEDEALAVVKLLNKEWT